MPLTAPQRPLLAPIAPIPTPFPLSATPACSSGPSYRKIGALCYPVVVNIIIIIGCSHHRLRARAVSASAESERLSVSKILTVVGDCLSTPAMRPWNSVALIALVKSGFFKDKAFEKTSSLLRVKCSGVKSLNRSSCAISAWLTFTTLLAPDFMAVFGEYPAFIIADFILFLGSRRFFLRSALRIGFIVQGIIFLYHISGLLSSFFNFFCPSGYRRGKGYFLLSPSGGHRSSSEN